MGFAHGLEKGKAEAKVSRHRRPTRGGTIVNHAGGRIDVGGGVDVVANLQRGRVMSDGEPGPAAVLGDDELYFDTNAQSGLINPCQKDLAVSAAVGRLSPGAAIFRVQVISIDRTVITWPSKNLTSSWCGEHTVLSSCDRPRNQGSALGIVAGGAGALISRHATRLSPTRYSVVILTPALG